MNNKYETHCDDSGLYVARGLEMPGLFVEAYTLRELDEQVALAMADLDIIHSDRPAIRSLHVDLVRLTLVDQGFVSRGEGRGAYEIWAKGDIFLTVPSPIRAKRTPALVFGFIFKFWKHIPHIE